MAGAQIRRFLILHKELDADDGEITRTQKVRRGFVAQRYAPLIAALYGGGLVAWFYGGMEPAIFIARLHEAVSVTHFEVGIIKAPFMALVIGIVACSEGLRVKGSAESLGRQTTTSVVKSIFLVIVLDGLFAVFFASIGM